MTVDTDRPIETGRTWQDLPPEPPLGDPLEPALVPPTEPPIAGEEAAATAPWRRVAAVLLLLIVALLLWLLLPRGEETAPPTTVPSSESTEPSTGTTEAPEQVPPAGSGEEGGSRDEASTLDEPVADVAAALLPSVVQIETGFGVGSGFVYDETGLIFTAAHVVSGASEVDVTFSDGRSATGTVVARDLENDVAVVAADAGDLTAAPLSGDEVRIGQTAIAVGSPFGLEQSVTVGVISGLDRSLDVIGRTITGLIQTDAAINVGNSGGPLADGAGRVIGITIAIATASGGSDGVGFAVPIEVALSAAGGVTADSPAAPVDDPIGPLGLNPLGDVFGDLFGAGSGFGDLDQMLELLGGLGLVPDGFEDLMGELDQLGQDLEGIGQDLEGLGLDDLGLGDLGLDGLGFGGLGGGSSDTLFELGALPDGFVASGDQLYTTNGVTTQVATIAGPDGSVTVRATAGTEATNALEKAAGAVTSVRGQLGKIDTTPSRVAVRWVERGVLFEALAPAVVGSDRLLEIVEAMEVVV